MTDSSRIHDTEREWLLRMRKMKEEVYAMLDALSSSERMYLVYLRERYNLSDGDSISEDGTITRHTSDPNLH